MHDLSPTLSVMRFIKINSTFSLFFSFKYLVSGKYYFNIYLKLIIFVWPKFYMVTYELKTLFLQYSTGVLHQLTNKKLWSLNFLLTIIESPQLHPQSSVLNYKAVPETVFKTFEEEKHRCWQRASSEEELIKSRYNLWITACLTMSPQFFFSFFIVLPRL